MKQSKESQQLRNQSVFRRALIAATGLAAVIAGAYSVHKMMHTPSTKVDVTTFTEAVINSAKRQKYLESFFGQLEKYTPKESQTKIRYEHDSYSSFLRKNAASQETYGLPDLWKIRGIPNDDIIIPTTTIVDGDLTPEGIGQRNTIYVFRTAFGDSGNLEKKIKDKDELRWSEIRLKGHILYESIRADHLAQGIPDLDTNKFRLQNGRMNMDLFDRVSAIVARTKECAFYEFVTNKEKEKRIKENAEITRAAYLIMLDRWNRDLEKKDLVKDVDPAFIKEIREVLSR